MTRSTSRRHATVFAALATGMVAAASLCWESSPGQGQRSVSGATVHDSRPARPRANDKPMDPVHAKAALGNGAAASPGTHTVPMHDGGAEQPLACAGDVLVRGSLTPPDVGRRLSAAAGRAVIQFTNQSGVVRSAPIDSNGAFEFHSAPQATYDLTLAATVPNLGLWTISAGSVATGAPNQPVPHIEVDATTLRWRTIQGDVTFADQPAEGQLMLRPLHDDSQAEPAGGPRRDIVAPVRSGVFEATIAPGTYAVGLRPAADAGTMWLARTQEWNTETPTLEFAFGPPASITLTVCGRDGKTVPNQPFALRSPGSPPGAPLAALGRTDPDGTWRVPPLQEGAFELVHLSWAEPPRPGERLTPSSPKARWTNVASVFVAAHATTHTVYGAAGWQP